MSLTAPDLLPEAARLYQQISPNAGDDASNGWAAANLCAVITAQIEDLASWVADTDDMIGWGVVLDVDLAPLIVLYWLGQFNGVQVDTTLPEDEQRRQIREARGSHRGRPSAIVSDIQTTLTGTKFVDIIERDGGPFLTTVVVRLSETPDSAATTAALLNRATKPLGVLYSLSITDSPIVAEYTRLFSAITVPLATATLADVT